MKKKRLLIILMILTLVAGTLVYISPPLAYKEVPLPQTYSIPDYRSWNENPQNDYILTQEEALYDFDYMWTMLYANAPLLKVIDNWPGKYSRGSIQRGIASVRRIVEGQDQWSLEEFTWLLNQSFGSLLGKGHFGVMDNGPFYGAFIDTFERYRHESQLEERLYQVASNPKSREAYLYLQKKEWEKKGLLAKGENGETPKYEKDTLYLDENYTTEDLSSSIYVTMKGDIPVLTIHTVLIQKAEEAAQMVRQLFEQNSLAQDLIVDIRGNSGGNSAIFIKGIVQPLLEDGGSYYGTYGMKESLLTRFYRIDESTLTQQEKDTLAYNRKFAANHLFTQQSEMVIDSADTDFSFTGNLWVLVDHQVASAGEDFVNIVKKLKLGTVVGETTAGAGNGGQPVVFPLTNSGLLVMYEDIIGFNENGTATSLTGIEPDVVNDKETDALATCLRLIEEGYAFTRLPAQKDASSADAFTRYLQKLVQKGQDEREEAEVRQGK